MHKETFYCQFIQKPTGKWVFVFFADIINYMDYEEELHQIAMIEENILSRLSRLRAKKDAVVSNYIAKLREEKIKSLREKIQHES